MYDNIFKEIKMISYSQNEILNISELSKPLTNFIEKISTKTVEKLAIVNQNKAEAIIISADRYEKILELEEFLDDLEVAQIIKERVLDRKEPVKMLSQKEMMEFLKESGCNV